MSTPPPSLPPTPASPPVVSTPTPSPTPVVTSTPRIHSGIPTRPMSSGYRHDGHHDFHYRRPYYHRPIYYGGYYPRYYDDWRYTSPSTVFVTEETKKEDFNYLPIYAIGGISVIALLVALQKK